MLFRDEPRAKLGAFNTWMSADAISHVIGRLEMSLFERVFAAVAAG